MKKIVCGIFILLLSCLTIIGIYAAEDAEILEKDGFMYVINETRGAAIIGCTIDEKSINIPQKLGSHFVKEICEYAFESCIGLEYVFIPELVNKIDDHAFAMCYNLKEITVDKNNKSYANEPSGILFNKLKTVLIHFPANNPLKKIVISEKVHTVLPDAFAYCPNLENITVRSRNKFFSDIDGVLYNKDCTELIRYPAGKGETDIIIGEGVVTVSKSAFQNCDFLETLTLSSSVEHIEFLTFLGCNSFAGFIVDEANEYFTCDEYGVLYSKDMTAIVKFPNAPEFNEYSVADTVTKLESGVFFEAANIAKLRLPESVKIIKNYAFYGFKADVIVFLGEPPLMLGGEIFLLCDHRMKIYYKRDITEWEDIIWTVTNGPPLSMTAKKNP